MTDYQNADWEEALSARLRPFDGSGLERLTEWVVKKGKPLTVFDLEANQRSPHFKGFGIMEVGLVHFSVEGDVFTAERLVNPERKISPVVTELTGLREADVIDQPTWGDSWRDIFHELASAHITAGFNSWYYDCPAVRLQNERYGQPDTKFLSENHIDIYELPEVGNMGLQKSVEKHEIPVSGDAHRALADAIATARLLDRVILTTPSNMLLPSERRSGAKAGARRSEIEAMVAAGEKIDVEALAVKHNLAPSTIESDLIALIGTKRIDPTVVHDAAQQSVLEEQIRQAIAEVWTDGADTRLRPLMEWLAQRSAIPLDYFQLKIGLIRAGYNYVPEKRGWAIAV